MKKLSIPTFFIIILLFVLSGCIKFISVDFHGGAPPQNATVIILDSSDTTTSTDARGLLDSLAKSAIGKIEQGFPITPDFIKPDEPQQEEAEIIPNDTPKPPDVAPTYGKTYTESLIWNKQHQRPFVWLQNTGAFYGGKIKLTIKGEKCGEIIVPDATDNYVPTTGIRYFCGTKNRPKESNGIRASVFGPVGCTGRTLTITRIER